MKGIKKMKKIPLSLLFQLIFFAIIILFCGEYANAQFSGETAYFVVDTAYTFSGSNADSTIAERLVEMGFEVEVVHMDEASEAATDGMSLVLISGTVSSSTTTTNMPDIASLAIPVICWEPFLYDHLGFQESDLGEYVTTEINIVDASHPIAAGLPEGAVTISLAEKAVGYGAPQGDVDIIAVKSTADTAVLFAYDTEAAMFSGSAPARRVATFLLNDIAADSITEDGWALFDASVTWAMGLATPIFDKGATLINPREFVLYDNYPNPFNPMTSISFYIPAKTSVRLYVCNTLGQKIATLVDEIKPMGNHTVTFTAPDISSGLYFYTLETRSRAITKKMLFIK
jgi:hypothetical protein